MTVYRAQQAHRASEARTAELGKPQARGQRDQRARFIAACRTPIENVGARTGHSHACGAYISPLAWRCRVGFERPSWERVG